MTIAQAETLKTELTDKYVIVNDAPELRRFAGLTGQVKTVNMNGRALVQFDGAVDISWYDIDPSCLTVIDKPLPKKTPEVAKKDAAPAAKADKPKATAGGKSPLEMARAQGAGGAAPAGGKKLSPLELARQQGAGGGVAAKPADKKLSPLELARQQGAAKAEAEAAKAAVEEEKVIEEPAPVVEEPIVEAAAPAASSSGTATPGSTAEIIALAKEQGAIKG